jgi:Fe-S-cluster containining protein
MKTSTAAHPCLSCGACCASFRVAFHWREAEKGSRYEVPVHFTVDLDSHSRCMKGTESKHNPRCTSLRGKIGQKAWCFIYSSRPSPCRAFRASYENGYENPRCDEARRKHGLLPLTKQDWKAFLKEGPESRPR